MATNKMRLRNLLLLDGVGAVVSTTMLGGVLMYFQEYIGMPKVVLTVLAISATGFAVFSLSNYFRESANLSRCLRTIAILNLTYCVVSAGLVIFFYEQLTTWGVIYFILEKVIVVPLALFELKEAQSA